MVGISQTRRRGNKARFRGLRGRKWSGRGRYLSSTGRQMRGAPPAPYYRREVERASGAGVLARLKLRRRVGNAKQAAADEARERGTRRHGRRGGVAEGGARGRVTLDECA